MLASSLIVFMAGFVKGDDQFPPPFHLTRPKIGDIVTFVQGGPVLVINKAYQGYNYPYEWPHT